MGEPQQDLPVDVLELARRLAILAGAPLHLPEEGDHA
jgi:hypothetical protein